MFSYVKEKQMKREKNIYLYTKASFFFKTMEHNKTLKTFQPITSK